MINCVEYLVNNTLLDKEQLHAHLSNVYVNNKTDEKFSTLFPAYVRLQFHQDRINTTQLDESIEKNNIYCKEFASKYSISEICLNCPYNVTLENASINDNFPSNTISDTTSDVGYNSGAYQVVADKNSIQFSLLDMESMPGTKANKGVKRQTSTSVNAAINTIENSGKRNTRFKDAKKVDKNQMKINVRSLVGDYEITDVASSENTPPSITDSCIIITPSAPSNIEETSNPVSETSSNIENIELLKDEFKQTYILTNQPTKANYENNKNPLVCKDNSDEILAIPAKSIQTSAEALSIFYINSTSLNIKGPLVYAQAFIGIEFDHINNLLYVLQTDLNELYIFNVLDEFNENYLITLFSQKDIHKVVFNSLSLFNYLIKKQIIPRKIYSICTIYEVINYDKKYKSTNEIIKEYLGIELSTYIITDIDYVKKNIVLLPKMYDILRKLASNESDNLIPLIENEHIFDYFVSQSLYLGAETLEGKQEYLHKSNNLLWEFKTSRSIVTPADYCRLDATITNLHDLYNTGHNMISALGYNYKPHYIKKILSDVYRSVFITLCSKPSFYDKNVTLITLNENGFTCILPSSYKRSINDLITHRLDIITKKIDKNFIPHMVLKWS